MVVELTYWVTFGKCDCSNAVEWEVELTEDETKIYNDAIASGVDPNDVTELQDALQRAYEAIEAEEK